MILLNFVGQILYCLFLVLLCAIFSYLFYLMYKFSRLDLLRIFLDYFEKKSNINNLKSPYARTQNIKKKQIELSDIDRELFKNLGFNLKPINIDNTVNRSKDTPIFDNFQNAGSTNDTLKNKKHSKK
jgi:hypothetical protein